MLFSLAEGQSHNILPVTTPRLKHSPIKKHVFLFMRRFRTSFEVRKLSSRFLTSLYLDNVF